MTKKNIIYTKKEVKKAVDRLIAYTKNYITESDEIENNITKIIEENDFEDEEQTKTIIRKMTLNNSAFGNYTPFKLDIQKFEKTLNILKTDPNLPSSITIYKQTITDFNDKIKSVLKNKIIVEIEEIQTKSYDAKLNSSLQNLKENLYKAYGITADLGTAIDKMLYAILNKNLIITNIEADEDAEIIRIDFSGSINNPTYFFEGNHFWFVYKLLMCRDIGLPYITLYSGRDDQKKLIKKSGIINIKKKSLPKNLQNLIINKKNKIIIDQTGFKNLYREVYDNTWSSGHSKGVQKCLELSCFIEPTGNIIFGDKLNGFHIFGFLFEYHKRKKLPKVKPLNKQSPEYIKFTSPKTKSPRNAPAGRKSTKDPTPFGR